MNQIIFIETLPLFVVVLLLFYHYITNLHLHNNYPNLFGKTNRHIGANHITLLKASDFYIGNTIDEHKGITFSKVNEEELYNKQHDIVVDISLSSFAVILN